ncbi:monovalent cation/H(+) antiporter subunit G [Nocardiopsis akebiae]|uniref:Monovalent cation/H(+) antiporter subunit G n=1 Tax=Nocardiopsis akebiae TaxID=2831968 RepID=A0ABX8C1U6_9ACTN|nr:monovalent cation/H(+) antiporter subunit G [Nocardiopsis akebiae]QUX27081.1 monovalent cation/H(+) antiporter subunit G [Nocardiopsis akebiae]
MTPFETLAAACVIAGASVFAVGALGLVRLRDFYARLHGVSVSAGLGTALLLLGLLLWFPSVENALKIGLALLVQLATAAVGGNALARAGYLAGTPLSAATRHDALADADPDRSEEG